MASRISSQTGHGWHAGTPRHMPSVSSLVHHAGHAVEATEAPAASAFGSHASPSSTQFCRHSGTWAHMSAVHQAGQLLPDADVHASQLTQSPSLHVLALHHAAQPGVPACAPVAPSLPEYEYVAASAPLAPAATPVDPYEEAAESQASPSAVQPVWQSGTWAQSASVHLWGAGRGKRRRETKGVSV